MIEFNTDINKNSNFIKSSQLVTFDNPNKLVVYRCDFDISHYHYFLFDELKIDCPSTIKNSVLKRRAEFLAGRYAASLSLQEFDINLFKIEIGKHRSPVWPDEIVASISHTNNTAFCAAASKCGTDYIGIDFANWLTDEMIQMIKGSIIQSKEEKLLQDTPLGFNKSFTLVFSAKESLFKALYLSVGYYFDFSAAEMTEICFIQNKFKLVLSQSLTNQLSLGTHFYGQFKFDAQGVLTLIVE